MCKRSLAEWLADNNYGSSRSVSTIKRWLKQLVTAVGYIHKKNLIHRDLKVEYFLSLHYNLCSSEYVILIKGKLIELPFLQPSNILFAENDRLKLCDLGIATVRRKDGGVQTELTRTDIGTALYMSPEQVSIISVAIITDPYKKIENVQNRHQKLCHKTV